jgi:PAS domain S-box-containing protein
MIKNSPVQWPLAKGEMARRVREHAWEKTSLGPAETWPQSLRSFVDLVLSSGFPMLAAWGSDLLQIYNDPYCEIIEARHPAALGQPIRDTWPDDWPGVSPIFERVAAGETVGHVDMHVPVVRGGVPRDAWFEVSFSPLHDETGAVAGALITLVEMTERVQLVTRLRDSEERFRALVQNVRDSAIFRLDAAGRVTEWPPGAARLFGHGEEMIGRHSSVLYAPDDLKTGLPVEDLLRTNAAGRCETEGWRVRRDGSRFWANEITTAIRSEDGAVVGYTKVSRDVSDQKQILDQRELLLAEATAARAEAERANRAKDQFLITLSHELRTPLAPILLWARALRDGSVPPHETAHAIDAIVISAESQLQLIEDLRDLSRLESGRMQLEIHGNSVEDVARAAVEVIRPTARAKGVAVELEVTPDLGNALLDRGRFQQVLWNLLSNAVKFTPDGGRVSLRVRRHGEMLDAVVTDTGQGIEADFLPHLFQRFRQGHTHERLRYGGMGVGLALCRYLVELHGGTIEGHSDGPGRGAVFVVRMPWIAAAPESDERQDVLVTNDPAPALRGLTVLLVEDDENMRDIMTWTLEGAGATVIGAGTGVEALAVLDASDDGNRRPDVMICDLGLPRMSGYELVRRVGDHRRARGAPAIPACAVTAFAREEDLERAIDAGFDSYVAKPMTAQRLIEAVEELAVVAATDLTDVV